MLVIFTRLFHALSLDFFSFIPLGAIDLNKGPFEI